MPAKKHHYVPVFYQKGFADAEGLLWVYDRKLKNYKHLHPNVMCRAEDLYAVRPDNAPKDRRIETDILSPIESDAAPIIRKLVPGIALSEEETAKLAFFIALQRTRLPSFGRAVSKMQEVNMEQLMRIQFANVDRATTALNELAAWTSEKVDIEPESMVKAVLNDEIKITATERPFLEAMFEQAKTLTKWMGRAHWSFLVAPASHPFILCDHPFTIVPPEGVRLDGVGPGLPGVVNYFPINRRLCLKLRHGVFAMRFWDIDSLYVHLVNRNVAANSERFIMCANKQLLEDIVASSGCSEFTALERFSVDVLKSDENESFVKFSFRPGRYFYNKQLTGECRANVIDSPL
ncbi:MAG TPA: DUF4238 domain-containing protein [Bryobacteraceae bacterium]|nr:DUF4238 domain-containing protein [Bryobacteraceae bacterium]